MPPLEPAPGEPSEADLHDARCALTASMHMLSDALANRSEAAALLSDDASSPNEDEGQRWERRQRLDAHARAIDQIVRAMDRVRADVEATDQALHRVALLRVVSEGRRHEERLMQEASEHLSHRRTVAGLRRWIAAWQALLPLRRRIDWLDETAASRFAGAALSQSITRWRRYRGASGLREMAEAMCLRRAARRRAYGWRAFCQRWLRARDALGLLRLSEARGDAVRLAVAVRGWAEGAALWSRMGAAASALLDGERWRGLRWGFGSWCALCDRAALAAHTIVLLRGRHLSRALRSWCEAVTLAQAALATLSGALMRWRQQSLCAALHVWARLVRQTALGRVFARRIIQRDALGVIARWRVATEEAADARHRLLQVVQMWRGNAAALAMQRWKSVAAAGDAARRAASLWSRRATGAAFRTWATPDPRRAQLRRAWGRWSRQALASAWLCWQDVVRKEGRLRVVVARITQRELVGALHTWASFVETMRWLDGMLSAWVHSAAAAAFRAWLEHLALLSEVRALLAQLVHRQLATAWRTWSAVDDGAPLIAHAIQRWRSHALRFGFEAVADVLRSVVRLRAVARQMIHRRLGAAFRTWWAVRQAALDALSALRGAALRWAGEARFAAIARWVTRTEPLLRSNVGRHRRARLRMCMRWWGNTYWSGEKQRRAVRRWLDQALTASVQAWASVARERAKLRGIARRWRGVASARAFHTWLGMAHARRRALAAALHVARRWQHLALASALDAFAREREHNRRVLARTGAYHSRRAEVQSMWSWRQHVRERTEFLSLASKSDATRARLGCRRGLTCWLELARARRSKLGALKGFVNGGRRRRLHSGISQWRQSVASTTAAMARLSDAVLQWRRQGICGALRLWMHAAAHWGRCQTLLARTLRREASHSLAAWRRRSAQWAASGHRGATALHIWRSKAGMLAMQRWKQLTGRAGRACFARSLWLERALRRAVTRWRTPDPRRLAAKRHAKRAVGFWVHAALASNVTRWQRQARQARRVRALASRVARRGLHRALRSWAVLIEEILWLRRAWAVRPSALAWRRWVDHARAVRVGRRRHAHKRRARSLRDALRLWRIQTDDRSGTLLESIVTYISHKRAILLCAQAMHAWHEAHRAYCQERAELDALQELSRSIADEIGAAQQMLHTWEVRKWRDSADAPSMVPSRRQPDPAWWLLEHRQHSPRQHSPQQRHPRQHHAPPPQQQQQQDYFDYPVRLSPPKPPVVMVASTPPSVRLSPGGQLRKGEWHLDGSGSTSRCFTSSYDSASSPWSGPSTISDLRFM